MFLCPQASPAATSVPDPRQGCSSSHKGTSGAGATHWDPRTSSDPQGDGTWPVQYFYKRHISCQPVRLSSFHVKTQTSEFLSEIRSGNTGPFTATRAKTDDSSPTRAPNPFYLLASLGHSDQGSIATFKLTCRGMLLEPGTSTKVGKRHIVPEHHTLQEKWEKPFSSPEERV